MAISSRFDAVVVTFPFTKNKASKRRPALVLSNAEFNKKSGHCMLAMIKSKGNKPWSLDVPITKLEAVGFTASSVLRWKLFTLDAELVARVIGRLSERDAKQLGSVIENVIP